jgi:hypothetical protein
MCAGFEGMDNSPSSRLLLLSLLALAACVDGSDLTGGGDSLGVGGDERPDDTTGTGNSGAGAEGAGNGGSTSTGSPPPKCDDPATPCYDQSCVDAGETFVPQVVLDTVLTPCATCGGGHCVPTAQLPSTSAELLDMLAFCDDTSVCVPDKMILTGGSPEPVHCTSIFGAEGRCMSDCIPDVKEQGTLYGLPTEGCATGEYCVPCYSPLDGSSTGACTVGNPGCDAPVEPPKQFPSCCDDKGGGICIPIALVGAAADRLDKEECAGKGAADSACVPLVIFNAQQSGQSQIVWDCCTTGGFIGGGQEGVCIPKCVPEADSFLVSQGSCGQDWENCAPCEMEVLGFAIDTGACEPVQL